VTTSREARIKILFKDEREAATVYKAVKPEETLPASAKCKVGLKCRKNVLLIEVEADNTAALRASLNSFLRWTMVAHEIIKRGSKN
jgi:KEOPS complex subunit Pcc1